jgi:hypothetical protein
MLNYCLVHMRNSAQQWFKIHNVGPSPQGRIFHAMASDETRVFVFGGVSLGVQSDGSSLFHGFDTSMYFLLSFQLNSLYD